jgi:hypothetical protein
VKETLAERDEFEPGLADTFCAFAPDVTPGGGRRPDYFRDHERGDPELVLEEYSPSFSNWLYERAKYWR